METKSKIAAQDSACQEEALSNNLQAASEVVEFEVFGQTQEAINGEPLDIVGLKRLSRLIKPGLLVHSSATTV